MYFLNKQDLHYLCSGGDMLRWHGVIGRLIKEGGSIRMLDVSPKAFTEIRDLIKSRCQPVGGNGQYQVYMSGACTICLGKLNIVFRQGASAADHQPVEA